MLLTAAWSGQIAKNNRRLGLASNASPRVSCFAGGALLIKGVSAAYCLITSNERYRICSQAYAWNPPDDNRTVSGGYRLTQQQAAGPQSQNALFAGSDVGGDNWAVIATLIENCKISGIKPDTWLTQSLTEPTNDHHARLRQISRLRSS